MRGRIAAAIPRVRRDLRLREDLVAQVDLILLDPVRQKIGYGKWSDLVESLLREWLAKQVRGDTPPVSLSDVQQALEQLESIPVAFRPQAVGVAINLLHKAKQTG